MNLLNYAFLISITFGFVLSSTEAQTDITCKVTEECLSFIENSVCTDGFCSCPENRTLSSDQIRCLLIAEDFESSCEENVQCSARLSTGGICSDNKCTCADNFHYLKGLCWKSAGLNEYCYQKEQCYADYEYIGFDCVNNKCQCRSGFYERYSACRRIMHESEFCSIDNDCQCDNGALATCKNSLCTCGNEVAKESFFEEDFETEDEDIPREYCKPGTFGDNCTLELGMECTNSTECKGISGPNSCYEGICSCIGTKDNSGQTIIFQVFVASRNNRKCSRTYSDITAKGCSQNEQCVVFGKNAVCENTVCKCSDASHWLEEDSFCWPTVELGEKCTSEKDCYVKSGLAECTGSPSTCSCKQGYHPRDGDCFQDSTHVGESCTIDNDCVFDNSKCDTTNKKCVCEKHYIEKDGLCVPGLNSKCKEDKQCSNIENALCNLDGEYCDCNVGFVQSESQEFCLSVANYSGKCFETVQCSEDLGELKECKNGLCLCNDTAHYSNGKCYKTKRLEEKCLNKLECIDGQDPESVVCLNGKCSCQYDYSRNSENKCVKDGDNASGKAEFSVLLISTGILLFLKNYYLYVR